MGNGISCTSTQNCFSYAAGVADRNIIPDNQMTASSRYDSNYRASDGRLNGGSAWCASHSDGNHDWLQVDLGKTFHICGVATQGNVLDQEWVVDFKLSMSDGGNSWTTYSDAGGSEMFHRNGGASNVDQHSLPVPVFARYIRFYPVTQHEWNCLRVEVYGIAF